MTTGALAIDTGIAIAAPPALVWALLTDFAHYPDWNRYVVRIDGSASAGEEAQVTTRDERSGRETTQPVRIAAVAPYLMHWVGEVEPVGTFRGDHYFELVPAASGGTVLRHSERFSGSAAAAILDAYGDALRANFRLFNRCLKDAAEARVSAEA